jgi:hypothetical protein
VGFEQRLLDHVGGIKPALEPGVDVHPRQQPKVLAVALQRARTILDVMGHGFPLEMRCRRPSMRSRRWEFFSESLFENEL